MQTRILVIIFLIVFTSFYTTNAVDTEGGNEEVLTVQTKDESKSIKELHNSIKDLQVEKRDISQKWDKLNKESSKIHDFIKTDLSEEDLKDLENILNNYFLKRESLDQLLKLSPTQQSIKDDIITIKLELYKLLTPYIRTEKHQDYILYIKSNVDLLNEDKHIKDDLSRKEEIF